MVSAYKKAKIVLQALKRILANQTPLRYSKEDLRIMVDVLEEIFKEMAKTDREREEISEYASIYKLIIDGFGSR